MLSLHWTALDQTAVLLALILSQIIFYLVLPASLQLLQPAGLQISLLSSNFLTLAAATPILMYKVGSCSSLKETTFPPKTEPKIGGNSYISPKTFSPLIAFVRIYTNGCGQF